MICKLLKFYIGYVNLSYVNPRMAVSHTNSVFIFFLKRKLLRIYNYLAFFIILPTYEKCIHLALVYYLHLHHAACLNSKHIYVFCIHSYMYVDLNLYLN